MSANDICWNTGDYSDGCNCEMCEHKYECLTLEEDGVNE